MPDIVIAGATFRNVPQIDIPKEGSGTASFVYEEGTKQITENGTGIDVSGYASVDVAVPSSSPVIQSLSVTQNGEYTAPSGVDGYSPVTVNVSGGGGGLEYETGTWTPSADVYSQDFYFTNSHSKKPICIMLVRTDNQYVDSANTIYRWSYIDWYGFCGAGYYYSSTTRHYGEVRYAYRSSQGFNITTKDSFITDPEETSWVTNTKFTASAGTTSRLWRSGFTYKWIAIWAPTT